MADNDAVPYPNNVSIVEAVGRGEVPTGLVNHYYNERAKAEDPDVSSENYFFPEGDLGNLLLVTAASVVDTVRPGRRGRASSSSSSSPSEAQSTSPRRPTSTRWPPGSTRAAT